MKKTPQPFDTEKVVPVSNDNNNGNASNEHNYTVCHCFSQRASNRFMFCLVFVQVVFKGREQV